ncbi:MAG: release factor glutamine methyltransferase [Pseudohongiellaceae bacterium]|jgi:release factor glutamine methyltransferase
MSTGTQSPAIKQHTGDNLYPASLNLTFGEIDLALDVPTGVWNPTPHGMALGHALAGLDFNGEHVLELGTGCGIHAALLAERGAAQLTLTEIEGEILKNASHNLKKHGVSCPTDWQVADWTHVDCEPCHTLVTNPPFTKSGKHFRRYFIDTLILDSHKLLKPGGRLIFIQSSMANIPRSIALMEECGMTVEVLAESDGPFRPYYFEDARYMKEMAAIPGAYTMRDGVHYERLIVLQGRLPSR